MTVCPRCGQFIRLRKGGETIVPHKDELVGDRCPMGGMKLTEGRLIQDKHREMIAEKWGRPS